MLTAKCGAVLVASFFAPALASAEEGSTPSWSPGRRTSGEVADGVAPDAAMTTSDGLYGRLDGDLAVRLGAGPEYSSAGCGLAAHAAAHFFYTAGVTMSYARSLEGSAPRNRLAAGIEARPLFLPRWSQDLEQGPAWLDLTIDSFGLGLAAFRDWGGPGATTSSMGLEGSLGLGAPLTNHAAGPWLELRGLRRWQIGASESSPVESALWLGLSWHAVLETELVPETAD